MGQLLLGIDIGTYSSKGVLVEPDGTVLRTQVVEHTMSIPQPGWAEQDADRIWWADFVSICHALLDGTPYSGEDVGGIAISAIGPCMLPLDAQGRPLRPGILYGVDARATDEIETLNNVIGVEKLFAFSRMALSSQAVGPKILWLKNHEPENWRKVDRITTASSYIIFRLSGEHVIDRHTASHYMPLMNQNMEWDATFADDVIGIDKLPRLGWSDELAGVVSAAGAEATGLRIGTPIAVGAVDALSEAISVGVTQPGDLMVMYGSTAFFILVQDSPTPDPRMWNVAGAYQGQFNLAAGMSTTGSLTRWFRDELAKDLPADQAYATLFENAEAISPGAGGLLVLPYFSGERTPINDPLARGVIAGLTLAHTRDHLYRAVLESVAYGIRHNLETFTNIGADLRRVVAVGGGTKSRAWMQIVSDVTSTPQIIPQLTIGASYGDAFLAGLVAGILNKDDLNSWVKPAYIIEPDPERSQQYQPFYRNYLSLYGATKDIVHDLGKA
jgi:xylulokinase